MKPSAHWSTGVPLLGLATAICALTWAWQGSPPSPSQRPERSDCLSELGNGRDADVFAKCNADALRDLPQPRALESEARELRRVIAVLGNISSDDIGGFSIEDGAVILRVVRGRSLDVAAIVGATSVSVRTVTVERSEAELLVLAERLRDDPRLGADGLSVIQYGPDVGANAVRLVLGAEVSQASIATLQSDYGPALIIDLQKPGDNPYAW